MKMGSTVVFLIGLVLCVAFWEYRPNQDPQIRVLRKMAAAIVSGRPCEAGSIGGVIDHQYIECHNVKRGVVNNVRLRSRGSEVWLTPKELLDAGSFLGMEFERIKTADEGEAGLFYQPNLDITFEMKGTVVADFFSGRPTQKLHPTHGEE